MKHPTLEEKVGYLTMNILVLWYRTIGTVPLVRSSQMPEKGRLSYYSYFKLFFFEPIKVRMVA